MPEKKPPMARDARPNLTPARGRVVDVPIKSRAVEPVLRRPQLPGGARPAVTPIKAAGVTMMPGKPLTPKVPIQKRPSFPINPGLGGGAFSVGMPFHVTADALVAPGATISPNIQSLRAPNGQGMLVDEVKFEISYLLADGNVSLNGDLMNLGVFIGCQLQVEGEPLTNGFVPLSMFGPTRSTVAEYQNISATIGFSNICTWRPPVPIWVPPGGLLEPTFVNFGLYNAVFRVRVSYSGIGGSRPKVKGLPYVMVYSPDAYQANGTEVERVSNEKDLVNPFETSLHVNYLLGRVFGLFQDVGNGRLVAVEGNTINFSYPYMDVYAYTKFQMQASWGTPIVRDYVRWPQVFDPWTRMLEIAHELPPQSYYIVGIKGGSVADATYDGQGLARIALVGWREVP